MSIRTSCGTALASFLVPAACPPASAAPSDTFVQPMEHFAAAIDNESLSYSFVLITAIDGRSGAKKAGCIQAPYLLGAIHRELKIGYSAPERRRARDIALAAPEHRFTFSDPEALRNIRFETLETNEAEACGIVRRGRPAFQAHRSLVIVEG